MKRIAHGYGLVEAPVYSADHGLLFSDVLGGGVYAVDDAGDVTSRSLPTSSSWLTMIVLRRLR